MSWEKVQSNFWKPKEKEELVGNLVGFEETQYGQAGKIQTEQGTFLVNYTALNAKLKEK